MKSFEFVIQLGIKVGKFLILQRKMFVLFVEENEILLKLIYLGLGQMVCLFDAKIVRYYFLNIVIHSNIYQTPSINHDIISSLYANIIV